MVARGCSQSFFACCYGLIFTMSAGESLHISAFSFTWGPMYPSVLLYYIPNTYRLGWPCCQKISTVLQPVWSRHSGWSRCRSQRGAPASYQLPEASPPYDTFDEGAHVLTQNSHGRNGQDLRTLPYTLHTSTRQIHHRWSRNL